MFLTATTRTLLALLLTPLTCAFESFLNAQTHRPPRPDLELGQSPSTTQIRRRLSAQDFALLTVDGFIYMNMSFGSPEQSFRMQIDTGSGDMFLSVFCPDCHGAGFPPIYDPTKSSTAVNKSNSIFSYDDEGNVVGYIFSDILWDRVFRLAGDVRRTGARLRGQRTHDKDTGLADGVGAGPAPQFAIWLRRTKGTKSPDTEGPGGVFTFGGMNASLFSGGIEFLNLTGVQQSLWQLNISEISVRGKPMGVTTTTRRAAIDTSSSFIVGPDEDVAALWGAVPGASKIDNMPGWYQFPCSTNLNFSVSFGGRSWPINDTDITLESAPPDNGICTGLLISDGQQTSETDPDVGNWIFGVPFLLNVYSVFRSQPPAIGFAELSTLAGGTGAPNATVATSASVSIGSNTALSTTTPSPTQSGSEQQAITKQKNVGAIAGGVIAGVIGFFLIAFVIAWRRSRTRRSRDESKTNGEYTPGMRRTAHPHIPVLTPVPFEGGNAAGPSARSHSSKVAPVSTDPTSPTYTHEQPAPWREVHTAAARGPTSERSLPLPSGAQTPAPQGPAILRVLESLRNELREVRSLAFGDRAGRESGMPPPDYE
ncbi:Lysosomal aspartic protease [Mycena venus]|uniref:Lysosomal aspartic protease n=1 Tax=Mycena venus TaxID=2733690 RepID=A0A8H6XYR4_9AGAR|nr:Lysosomal aspartic protease [Mycena venus]